MKSDAHNGTEFSFYCSTKKWNTRVMRKGSSDPPPPNPLSVRACLYQYCKSVESFHNTLISQQVIDVILPVASIPLSSPRPKLQFEALQHVSVYIHPIQTVDVGKQ
jgi:hypothetical protein